MSKTYFAGFMQFVVSMGLITASDADLFIEAYGGVLAVIALAGTMYGRYQAGGIKNTLSGMLLGAKYE